MITAAAYTEFIRAIPERAKRRADALQRRKRYGCCTSGGENQVAVTCETWSLASGDLKYIGSHVVVRCNITHEICPAAALAALVAFYGRLNGGM